MTYALVGIGLVMLLIGGLSLVGYIPNLTPQSSVPLCVQSIAKLATVCVGAFPTGIDSITYEGTIIAPVLNNNPVGVAAPIGATTIQGKLTAYYFLGGTGNFIYQYAIKVCEFDIAKQACRYGYDYPYLAGTYNSGGTFGTTSAGINFMSVQTKAMKVGTYYKYVASIVDHNNLANSTLSGIVIPIAAAPTWVASVKTLNGTFIIGGSSATGLTSGVNVYNVEAPYFTVTITNNAIVKSVSISVLPSGQTIYLTNIGHNVWAGSTTFAVGAYTLTGIISDGAKVTAFSIRLTSINQLKLTQVTQTVYSTSCPFSTSTAASPPYTVSVCSSTQGQTLTITDTGCYTGTATTTSSTTIQSTTCSTVTNTCDAGGCTGTTTLSTTAQTTASGSTTTSTGASTTTQTQSTSTTQVCQSAVCDSTGGNVNWVGIMLTIGGAVAMVFGFVRRDDD